MRFLPRSLALPRFVSVVLAPIPSLAASLSLLSLFLLLLLLLLSLRRHRHKIKFGRCSARREYFLSLSLSLSLFLWLSFSLYLSPYLSRATRSFRGATLVSARKIESFQLLRARPTFAYVVIAFLSLSLSLSSSPFLVLSISCLSLSLSPFSRVISLTCQWQSSCDENLPGFQIAPRVDFPLHFPWLRIMRGWWLGKLCKPTPAAGIQYRNFHSRE